MTDDVTVPRETAQNIAAVLRHLDQLAGRGELLHQGNVVHLEGLQALADAITSPPSLRDQVAETVNQYYRASPNDIAGAVLAVVEPIIRAQIAVEIAMADWSGLTPGREREAAIRIAGGDT